MRHVKAALVGLAAAVILTAAVLGAEMVFASRSVNAQMASCENALAGGGGICSGYAQLGGTELPVLFVLGFVSGYAWILRRQRVFRGLDS